MMTRGRLVTVYALLAVLVGGHLFDNVRRTEHWPFSNYPMFASVEGNRLQTYRFTCLYADGTGAIREMDFNPDWVPSLPQYKFADPMRDYLDWNPNPTRVHQLLADYLATYDACRRAGLNHGPDVTAVRVYRVTIPLEVPLRRFDLDHRFADYARLAVQVDQPAGAAATRPTGAPPVRS